MTNELFIFYSVTKSRAEKDRMFAEHSQKRDTSLIKIFLKEIKQEQRELYDQICNGTNIKYAYVL